MVARDLVATRGVNDIVYNHEPECLIHSGRETAPGEFFQFVIDAGNDPDIAVMGAEGGALAVGEKVHTAKADAAFPGIVGGRGEGVGSVSAIGRGAGTEHAFSNDGFGPARGPTLFEFDHLRLASEKFFLLFF